MYAKSKQEKTEVGFFQNNPYVKEEDYNTYFESFKSDTYEDWGYPKNEVERNNVLKELHQNIQKYFKSKDKCKTCIEMKRKMDKHKILCVKGHNDLKRKICCIYA